MIRKTVRADRWLLGAIFVGLNLLCFRGIAHGRHVVHHTRVNYSHIPVHATRRAGSRSGREGLISSFDAIFDHSVVDHAPKSALSKGTPSGSSSAHVALATATFFLPQPEERTEPLALVNVVALGSAPRAPGLGRAPPITA